MMIPSPDSPGAVRQTTSVFLANILEMSKEALVSEPEHIKARLVARLKLLVAELSPAAFGICLGVPSLLAHVPIGEL
jgi:hypothetical protein